ncbi:MAG: hypothetical protein LBP38_03560 [Desulfovibrio sp.]|nr:hypothetical protein [Desulfovibrio sp.]
MTENARMPGDAPTVGVKTDLPGMRPALDAFIGVGARRAVPVAVKGDRALRADPDFPGHAGLKGKYALPSIKRTFDVAGNHIYPLEYAVMQDFITTCAQRHMLTTPDLYCCKTRQSISNYRALVRQKGGRRFFNGLTCEA